MAEGKARPRTSMARAVTNGAYSTEKGLLGQSGMSPTNMDALTENASTTCAARQDCWQNEYCKAKSGTGKGGKERTQGDRGRQRKKGRRPVFEVWAVWPHL